MAGTMLDLLRKNVERRYGRTTWATLVGGPEAPAAGRAVGREPNGAESRANDAPSEALACWLGRQGVARVARDWPDLFDRHPDLRTFLTDLGGRTGGPALHGDDELSLGVSVFEGVDSDLFVRVEGEGSCCALVEGLIAGAAERYGERARLELLKCRHRGDNRCVIRVAFDVAEADGDLYFLPLSAERRAERRARVV